MFHHVVDGFHDAPHGVLAGAVGQALANDQAGPVIVRDEEPLPGRGGVALGRDHIDHRRDLDLSWGAGPDEHQVFLGFEVGDGPTGIAVLGP